jgi:hypothetical protein
LNGSVFDYEQALTSIETELPTYQRFQVANHLMAITLACAATRSEVRSTVRPYEAAVIVLGSVPVEPQIR